MHTDRFGIAQDGKPVTGCQLDAQLSIRDKIAEAGDLIKLMTDEGREQSLALTKLEEALMWAGKAVFK